jgi:methionyl-tRNA synthetase
MRALSRSRAASAAAAAAAGAFPGSFPRSVPLCCVSSAGALRRSSRSPPPPPPISVPQRRRSSSSSSSSQNDSSPGGSNNLSRADTFFVTAPIFYANGDPHVGHVFTALLCDAAARFNRAIKGKKVLFSLGLDEHGQKVQKAALESQFPTVSDVPDEQRPEVLDASGVSLNGDGSVAAPSLEDTAAVRRLCLKYTDKQAAVFSDCFKRFNISHTDFIRTTQGRHAQVVRALFALIQARDDIYPGSYEGWYAESDEAFVAEDDTIVEIDGRRVAKDSGSAVEWTSEQNFKFRLGKHAPAVLAWIEESERANPGQGQAVVEPAVRREEVKRFLRRLMLDKDEDSSDSSNAGSAADLSVSRPRRRIPFGIDVDPFPTSSGVQPEPQTVYVWLDALANYLTVAGLGGNMNSPDMEKFAKFWPPDLQVIGKDIAKFHAVYWPAFLLSAFGDGVSSEGDPLDFDGGLEGKKASRWSQLPKKIVAHGHWLVGGRKMSKSVGNVVDPVGWLDDESVPVDFWRYLLLSEARNLGEDSILPAAGEFGSVRAKVRADLVGTYGNLFTRTMRLNLPAPDEIGLGPSEVCSWDAVPGARDLVEHANQLRGDVFGAYEQCEFAAGTRHVFRVLREANAFVEHEAPWESARLAREEGDVDRARHAYQVCYVAQEVLRVCSIYLLPIMPESCGSMLGHLGLPAGSDDLTVAELVHSAPDGQGPLRVGWLKTVLPRSRATPFDIPA